MNMGPDRFFYGLGMPMNAKAETRGGQVKGSIELSDRDTAPGGRRLPGVPPGRLVVAGRIQWVDVLQ